MFPPGKFYLFFYHLPIDYIRAC